MHVRLHHMILREIVNCIILFVLMSMKVGTEFEKTVVKERKPFFSAYSGFSFQYEFEK